MHPMLASPGTLEDLNNPDFIYEIKLDGVRCIATISDRIRLTSRTNKDITNSFPDIVDQLSPLCGRDVDIIFDGEIVTKSDNVFVPISDFQRLQTRLQRITDIDAAIAACPAEYIAFDLLSYEGVDQTLQPWHSRRNRLVPIASSIQLPITVWVDHTLAPALFELYTEKGVEGFMAKHRSSKYYPGTRSKEWRKIKPMRETTAWICGITHGYGRRKELFGGLVLGQFKLTPKTGLEFIGVVGSGLTDELMKELSSTLVYQTENPLTQTVADVKHWCTPTHIATCQYQELTKDQKLRFPSLKSVEKSNARYNASSH